METKHTPGPWVVRDADTMCPVIDSLNVGKGYWASLATATQRDPHPLEGGGISMKTARANARLIAAAPDLLEALEAVMDSWRVVCSGQGWDPLDLQEHRAAVAAIAKARGTT